MKLPGELIILHDDRISTEWPDFGSAEYVGAIGCTLGLQPCKSQYTYVEYYMETGETLYEGHVLKALAHILGKQCEESFEIDEIKIPNTITYNGKDWELLIKYESDGVNLAYRRFLMDESMSGQMYPYEHLDEDIVNRMFSDLFDFTDDKEKDPDVYVKPAAKKRKRSKLPVTVEEGQDAFISFDGRHAIPVFVSKVGDVAKECTFPGLESSLEYRSMLKHITVLLGKDQTMDILNDEVGLTPQQACANRILARANIK